MYKKFDTTKVKQSGHGVNKSLHRPAVRIHHPTPAGQPAARLAASDRLDPHGAATASGRIFEQVECTTVMTINVRTRRDVVIVDSRRFLAAARCATSTRTSSKR